MTYKKKSVNDIDLAGKKVLLRFDLDASPDGETGEAPNGKCIAAALPTIRCLLDGGAAVIACSHLGGRTEPLSLAPAAEQLAALLGRQVIFARDVVGRDAKAKAAALEGGQLMLLENTHFHTGEAVNDPGFSRELASMAQLYVSDAFASAHRAYASNTGAAAYLPAVSGLLMSRELEAMGRVLDHPARPFVAVLGGDKLSDRMDLMVDLLEQADAILVGGGMAYTFLKALGGKIGRSPFQPDLCPAALALLQRAKERGVKLFFPTDALAANERSPKIQPSLEGAMALFDDKIGMDIGPRTIALFRNVILAAGTVIWSGAMGEFEFPAFAKGTEGIAQAVAESNAVTVVCNGDSASVAEQLGYLHRVTHISAGGRAALACLAGKDLPGIACLSDR